MAQRDYVKKKAKTKKNSSRVIPTLMMIIAIALVIVFIAILYIVSTNKPNRPASQPQQSTQRPESVLPERPQERWTYLKELENPDSTTINTPPVTGTTPNTGTSNNNQTTQQERQQILDSFVNEKTTPVVTTQQPTTPAVVTPPVTSQGSWLLQCGAFKEKTNADAFRAKIAMSGVESEIKSTSLHRVVVGPFSTKTQAESTLETLKNNGITSCILTGK